ncbi:AAA family ATPase [Candidatus Bathyarchaeota archaeon A05DMB-3]|nr:AAA family ATPase [Candidatus Bathyarchaeota archaeon A05DMB-3]
MILNRVKLCDFVSHKDTQLDLDYGINVVVGPNGAGKTSILDAISFALFNDWSNRGRKENLINLKANRCKATIEFTEGGIRYSAEWSMERNKSAKGSLYRIQNGDRKLLAQGGGNTVVPEIEKILGIDKSMFLQSVYVRQGEIEELVTARPADRKELVSRLLGVEDLQKAWENIKSLIDDYQHLQTALKTELDQKSTIEAERRKYLATSKELAKSLESKRKELREIENKIRGLREVLDKLKVDKKEFDRLDKEKSILNQGTNNDKEKLQKEQSELDKTVKAEENVKNLESEVSKLPLLEEYVRYLSQKTEKELQLGRLNEKLTNLERLEKELKENEKDHTLYVEKKRLLDERTKERKKYEGAGAALKKALKHVKDFEKEEQKKKTELNKELEKCSEIIGEQATVENIETLLSAKKEEFQKLSGHLGKEVDECNKRIGMLENRKQELETNLDRLRPSEEEVKTCPTCETELTPDRLTYLMGKFSSEREQIAVELRTSVEKRDASAQEKQQIDEKLKKLASIDPEHVKSLVEQLTEVREKLAEQKSEVEELEKQVKALNELDSEISQLETEIDEHEESYLKYETAERELKKLAPREQIEAEIAPIKEAMEIVLQSLKDSILKLGYEPKEPEEELKELRLKKEEYDRNLPLAKRKTEHEQNIARIKQELSEKEQKLAEVGEAINRLSYDEKEHAKKQDEFDSENKHKGDLKEDIAGLTAQKKAADDEASKCEEKLKALKEKEREKQVVDDFIRLLNKIRAAYGKDGVQKMIRARARPLLEKATRDLFERFNLAYSDVKIDDDYNIAVIGPGGEQDIDQISGGERVALAIALRLAIARVLSGKVETIIMDEPTTHLDEERRKELVNILNSFFREGGRIIPQMLVITHHREIEDVADVIYNIRKQEGYSILETEK